MKIFTLILTLILFLLVPQLSHGAFALVVNSQGSNSALNPAVTSGVDTTGATFLVVIVAHFDIGGTTDFGPQSHPCSVITITDSKSNTWHSTTNYNYLFNNACVWYSDPSPTVGAAHTFTATPSGNFQYPSIFASAWSGSVATSPLDQISGLGNGLTGIEAALGPTTPVCDNELLIAVESGNQTTSRTIDAGFTVQDQINGSNSTGGWAYLIQTTKAEVNPTWQATPNAQHHVAMLASFKLGTGCPSSPPVALLSSTRIGNGNNGILCPTTCPFVPAVSPGMTTTGASLLTMMVSFDDSTPGTNACNVMTISDSKSNTWVSTTNFNFLGSNACFWYVVTPVTDAAHTFTITPQGSVRGYPTGYVAAWSGTATASQFDQINGNGNGSGNSTVQAGSITPTCNNELVIAFLQTVQTTTRTIDGGFTIASEVNVGSANLGGAWAYLVQTSKTAANPTWTLGGSLGVGEHQVATISSWKDSNASSCSTGSIRHRVIQ